MLAREQLLLTELFEKRKTLAYKFDDALAVLDYDQDRLQRLLDFSVLTQNGNYLGLDDQYLQFFEQVLEVNEEINVSYINEHIQSIKNNILYFLAENNEIRKHNYLKLVKNALRKIGTISLRNVVDLKRNTDNTFKNEPNYKIKKAKLEHLDNKRHDIAALIERTDQLISGEEERIFLKTAQDEELNRIITLLKLELNACRHNLIDAQRQIIEYLNKIKGQNQVMEKLRQLKYLRDQFELKSKTNIKEIVAGNTAVIFDSQQNSPLKLSLSYLQSGGEVLDILKKIALKAGNTKNVLKLAENIDAAYLEDHEEDLMQINLEEVKNSFMAGSNNLFDFLGIYNFASPIGFGERLTLYCQLVSQYGDMFTITDVFNDIQDVTYTMVYPK